VECHFITGNGNILVKLYCVDNEHLMRTIFDGILRIQVALHDLGDLAQLLDGLLQQLRVFERDADVGADIEAHHLGIDD